MTKGAIKLLNNYPKKTLKASLTSLKRAKGLVIEGWTQKTYFDSRTDGVDLVCAAGGLKRANGPGELAGFCALSLAINAKEALKHVRRIEEVSDDFAVDGFKEDDYIITNYNDHHRRRKIDVINKFNYAIKLVEKALKQR